MLGFHDTTRAIDERNEARMNFRTKPRIKNAIQQAAALSGVDDSVFTMNAAYQAALATIAAHEDLCREGQGSVLARDNDKPVHNRQAHLQRSGEAP